MSTQIITPQLIIAKGTPISKTGNKVPINYTLYFAAFDDLNSFCAKVKLLMVPSIIAPTYASVRIEKVLCNQPGDAEYSYNAVFEDNQIADVPIEELFVVQYGVFESEAS